MAYNKWLHELVAIQLGLPELYRALPPILSLHRLDSAELNEKADALRDLLESWTA